jgi:hypothetical protein
MTDNVPAILICTNTAKTNANRTWDAIGRGPNTFSVPLVAGNDANATHETEPTHWLALDMDATTERAVTWLGITQGNLPAPNGVWGEDGVISAQDAMAACMNGNVHVHSWGGGDSNNTTERDQWKAGILTGRNLKLRPDEPI